MKVHLIKRETIEEYVIEQARSRPSFEEWLEKIKRTDWQIPEDIMATFNSADLLGNGCDRVVFDIAGNNFRMMQNIGLCYKSSFIYKMDRYACGIHCFMQKEATIFGK